MTIGACNTVHWPAAVGAAWQEVRFMEWLQRTTVVWVFCEDLLESSCLVMGVLLH
jgi:hypothetical protein